MTEPFDLLVVGAGIHGAGLARDAAGRGLRVLLVDQGDIGGATSSASTKLIHGGLRYLEHFAFGLVREALAEREVLLSIAPHLVRAQRFVIPYAAAQRPRWLLRLGLALYDGLARGSSLERSEALALRGAPFGAPLKPEFAEGFAYSDLATDDARLTLLNALSAAQLGAQVMTRTKLLGARRAGGLWRAVLQAADGTQRECAARIVVNAAGPWAAEVRRLLSGAAGPEALRLVKGSHLVVPKRYEGEQAYLLQNADGRIAFVIPFERDFSLVSRFFRRPLTPQQAVWSFAGIRALYDAGRDSASALSRESRLILDGAQQAPLLSIYGGKLTTYRRLAERALERLKPWLPGLRPSWSAAVHLPGGGLGRSGLAGLLPAAAAGVARGPGAPPRHGGRARARPGANRVRSGRAFRRRSLCGGGRLPSRPRVGARGRRHSLAQDEMRPAPGRRGA